MFQLHWLPGRLSPPILPHNEFDYKRLNISNIEKLYMRPLMNDENIQLGRVTVSPRAIATIAFNAARQSYGVVGLTSKNLMDGITQVIVKDPTNGIEVKYDGEKISIDLYVIIEYGTRITTVASSVSNTVKFHVEKALGMPVEQVNVHVRGLRVSDMD